MTHRVVVVVVCGPVLTPVSCEASLAASPRCPQAFLEAGVDSSAPHVTPSGGQLMTYHWGDPQVGPRYGQAGGCNVRSPPGMLDPAVAARCRERCHMMSHDVTSSPGVTDCGPTSAFTGKGGHV